MVNTSKMTWDIKCFTNRTGWSFSIDIGSRGAELCRVWWFGINIYKIELSINIYKYYNIKYTHNKINIYS
jgi:hypothetical protein